MRNLIVSVVVLACVNLQKTTAGYEDDTPVHLSALTDEEIKVELGKLIVKCSAKYPVEVPDLFQLQKLKLPKKPEVYCLLACAYKMQGAINEKGLYDIEQAYKIAENSTKGNEQRFENAKKLADVCVTVNEVEVSDGDKGCERAALLFQCLVDNSVKFGFKM